MSINVIIYPDGGDTSQTASHFTDPVFEILPYNVLVGTDDPQLNEYLWIQGALKFSQRRNPSRSCIIVKNTSFSNYPSAKIAQICQNAIEVEGVDLFYLTKWDDLCNLYRSASEFTYWCYSPRGDQCILYTPSGISIVTGETKMPDGNYFVCKDMWLEECLNIQIQAGNLKATSLFGNLLDYDAIKYGTTNLAFNRLNECQYMTNGGSDAASPNIYLYVIGIIVLILIIAWGLYKIGPKEVEAPYRTKDKFDGKKKEEVNTATQRKDVAKNQK